ncbi:antiterminator Q family protein [Serratia inhibens]|uniref:antiterminator Q family protein n=1 Tax=Serratia inhibens TaxID=2338073 RepID=UPI0032169CB4
MNTDGLKLTKEQEDWLQPWLECWGAWVYTGRLEKRQSSIIAEYMATVEPSNYPERPICNDDDGMLITRVVDLIYVIDRRAFGLLLSRYVHGSSDRAIAKYYYAVAKPRAMIRRNGQPGFRRPSHITCRREVSEILAAAEYLLYQPLQDAFILRERERKNKKLARTC